MSGITLDTGALIAIERGSVHMRAIWAQSVTRGIPLTVPAPVVAEWWRGQRGPIAKLLHGPGVSVEPMTFELAKVTGLALGALQVTSARRVHMVDATVVASAALRGDVVFTADLDDLSAIRDVAFPGVRLMGVT